MRIKETKVYTYAELSDKAKERARQWWAEANAGDNWFAESATESFLEELKALGFDTREKDLSWSGFWLQGDGASFSGTWYASDCAPGELLANRPPVWPESSGGHACPANAELHRIAGEILACKKAGLMSAVVKQSHRGHCMSLDSTAIRDDSTDNETDAPKDLAERFLDAARDLAYGFYKTLEAEYEYQNSEAQITEAMEANGYEFDENGRLA